MRNTENKNRPAMSKNEQKGFYSNLSKTSREAIIPVFTNELGKKVVDARQLHKKLKTQTQFSKWIQRRIEEYDFQEGLEFYPNLTKTSKGSKGGRPTIEYQLTTIMAQELCLLDNSVIGKNIRMYLLQMLNDSQNQPNIFKDVPYLTINGRKLYCYRSLQRLLGYSTKSSISNIRRKYEDHLHMHLRTAYVTEEYALLMHARSEARSMAVKTLNSNPIIYTNQLILSI